LTITKRYDQFISMKAPPFTAENAAEMARRSVASRAAAKERDALAAAQAEQQARNAAVTSDELRRLRVQKQIDLLLLDMELARGIETRMQIGSAIERLWKLVQPTAGVNRPGRQSKRNAEAQPIETPQQSPDPAPADTPIPARDMSQEM
jgi:hypothetical protein